MANAPQFPVQSEHSALLERLEALMLHFNMMQRQAYNVSQMIGK